jgi:hypothetical protein
MSKKIKNIPVNKLPEESCRGIMMMRESFNGSSGSEQVERSHRMADLLLLSRKKEKPLSKLIFKPIIFRPLLLSLFILIRFTGL